jgi:lysophospholipase L1-like esterase
MESSTTSSRRKFLQQASVFGAAAFSSPVAFHAFPSSAAAGDGDHFRFLFQGDSITDGNRSRDTDWNHVMGHGYAYLIAARLLYRFPEKKLQFFNRGVSGNKITDLIQRWPEDALSLNPDLLSILIGINDTMNAVNGNKNCTISGFENDYRALLIQTREKLPAVNLVICEPFVLPVLKSTDQWKSIQFEIAGRQHAAKSLAAEFNAIYIPLQDIFNHAAEKNPPNDYWLWDGVHPMPNGHELIALEWLKEVGKKEHFIR